MIAANRPLHTGIADRIGKYSDAVEVPTGSRLVYLAGTPGIRADGTIPPAFEEQAELAWEHVRYALRLAEMDVGDLVKVTQYLTSADDVAAYTPIRNRALGEARPASMLMIVSGLVWPQMRIEIEAVAARPT